MYAYCLGLRSSRRIARALEEDVGFRVVAANQQPDFRTICRFRAEHEEALEKLFVEVLRLCHEAGLVKLGVVALDGTKVAANAALATNRSHQAIEEEVQRMLAEAKAADAEEDAHYGPDRRGDELPEGLGGRTERFRRLKEAKERLQREAEAAARAVQERVEQRRAEEVATGKKKRGRKPKVVESLPTEEAKANTTDPDSRIMKTRQGYVQGYNAQAVVSEGQIIVAVGVTQEANDVQQLEPMLQTMAHTLKAAGIEDRPKAGLADAGYWSEANIRACSWPEMPELLIGLRRPQEVAWRAEAATWSTCGSCTWRATYTMESTVDSALSLLLEAGEPFDYATVKRTGRTLFKPRGVLVLSLSGMPDLRVYDSLLAGVA